MRKVASAYSMSPTAASIAEAATSLPFSMMLSLTPSTAAPATGIERLPPVMPSGVKSESPCTMRIRSESTPSRADMICVKAVS